MGKDKLVVFTLCGLRPTRDVEGARSYIIVVSVSAASEASPGRPEAASVPLLPSVLVVQPLHVPTLITILIAIRANRHGHPRATDYVGTKIDKYPFC